MSVSKEFASKAERTFVATLNQARRFSTYRPHHFPVPERRNSLFSADIEPVKFHFAESRKFSTKPMPKTELIPVPEIITLDQFTEFKPNDDLSNSSAHTIFTGKLNGKRHFIKDPATNKEHPISEKYPDPQKALEYAEFLVCKEWLHSNMALSILGENSAPKTLIVVDNLENPQKFHFASQELTGYINFSDLAGRQDVDELFYVGKDGETRIKGFYPSPKIPGEYIPVDIRCTGRIAARNLSMFLGDIDNNPKNAGIIIKINSKGYSATVARIDFGCCGANMNYKAEELAFSAPLGVIESLAIPAAQHERLRNRNAAKQKIFDTIGNIDKEEISPYVRMHFSPKITEVFKDEIELMELALLNGRSQYEGAAKLHRMAAQSLFADGISK